MFDIIVLQVVVDHKRDHFLSVRMRILPEATEISEDKKKKIFFWN